MTGTKKDRMGLTGRIYVIGECSHSGNKSPVLTASDRLGNSELVCHDAWAMTSEVMSLVSCSARAPR